MTSSVSHTHPPHAVLDTDIIYSRVLHELMGRVARRLRLLDLFWSEELLTEARDTLVEKKGLPNDVAQRWVDYLPQNFPTGHTKIDKALGTTDLSSLTSDTGDHHVCALAIASGADLLFTHDRGYLRDGLHAHGVKVTAPDVSSTSHSRNNHEACSKSSSCRQVTGLEEDPSRNCWTRSNEQAPRSSSAKHAEH